MSQTQPPKFKKGDVVVVSVDRYYSGDYRWNKGKVYTIDYINNYHHAIFMELPLSGPKKRYDMSAPGHMSIENLTLLKSKEQIDFDNKLKSILDA